MRRFWIENKISLGDQLEIRDELFHHIRDVCRFEVGSKFEVLPGDGRALLAEVLEVQKRSLIIKTLEERKIPDLVRPWLNVYLCVPRFPVFETVLEKLSELGVYRVIPVFSDFSFVRGQDKISESRWQRWQKIIVHASQQTGRGQLLKLEQPLKLEKVLGEINPTAPAWGLFLYEGESRHSLRSYLHARGTEKPQEINLFIGAEGGFSEREVGLFEKAGLPRLTVGDQVLRVETACVALVSVIKYHFEDI